MFKVGIIVGSLRKESFNRKLALAIQKLNPNHFTFSMINIEDIPLFNQDHEKELPAPVVRLKQDIKDSDGLLFVTPEYNRSVPGVLKNVIDWGTRPYGQNAWAGKPTAILGASPGAIGTAVAQSHLRSILTSIDVPLLGFPEIYLVYKEDLINQNHQFTNPDTIKFLSNHLNKFNDWIKQHTSK